MLLNNRAVVNTIKTAKIDIMNVTNLLRGLTADTNRSTVTGTIMALMVFLSVLAVSPATVSATSHDVEINVQDPNGDYVDNASIDIINTSDGTVVDTGSTDTNGYYETNLTSGDYDIIVDHPDFETQNQIISHTSGTLSTVNFDLVELSGTIESTVTDSNGTAIDNATVDVVDPADGTIVTSGTTDSTGFTSINVSTGTYDVVASADGYSLVMTNNVDVTADTVTTTDFALTESTSDDTVVDNQFAINTTEGTPASLFVEVGNGTYDVTWYEVNDGNRTDFTTENINVTDGPIVHEFAPTNISESVDGDTYGVDIAYNATESPDATVLSSGILYDNGGSGSGSGTDVPMEVIIIGLIVTAGAVLVIGSRN
jgi:hypothetical protein